MAGFIIHFSTQAAPLIDLTGSWSPNQIQWLQEAVEHYAPYGPKLNEHFILQTDASDRGLGGVLLQELQGDRNPDAYISQKMWLVTVALY